MRLSVLYFFILILLWNCSSSKSTKTALAEEEYISKIEKDNFNSSDINEVYNDTHDFVIITKKTDRGVGFPDVIEFIVVDLKQKKIIYKDSVIDGSVAWIDNDNIEIKRVPEARSKDPEINRKAGKKIINVRKL